MKIFPFFLFLIEANTINNIIVLFLSAVLKPIIFNVIVFAPRPLGRPGHRGEDNIKMDL